MVRRVALALVVLLVLRRRKEVTRNLSEGEAGAALGALIQAEVSRAEGDLKEIRSRGQAVLTVSGALVTLLAAVVALAVGKDAKLELTGLTMGATAVALLAFVVATVFVLFILGPASVLAVSGGDLSKYARNNWQDAGWDKQVAIVSTIYLESLRRANGRLNNRLRGAVAAEVVGIAAASLMVMSLFGQS